MNRQDAKAAKKIEFNLNHRGAEKMEKDTNPLQTNGVGFGIHFVRYLSFFLRVSAVNEVFQ